MPRDLTIVEETRLLDFVSDALDLTPPQEVSHPCPHCGISVRYPKAVARGDLDQIRSVLCMLQEYADDNGITAKAIAAVMAECYVRIAQKR